MTNRKRLTPAEIEDAKYEIWVQSGGRESAEVKHEILAEATFAELTEAGYEILSKKKKRLCSGEFPVTELVIRKGDTVSILEWNTFNKGWMIVNANHGGSSIFRMKCTGGIL